MAWELVVGCVLLAALAGAFIFARWAIGNS